MFRRRKQEPSFFNNSDFEPKLEIKPGSSLEHQIEMIEITKEDLKTLRTLQPFVIDKIDVIVERFYSKLEKEKSLIEIIETHSSIERLKKTLRPHIIEMFSGEIDETYVKKRHQVALVHVHIGLKSHWYLAAFQEILSTLTQLVEEEINRRDEVFIAFQAITKIINLEEQLVLEMYETEVERLQEKHISERENIRVNVMNTSETLAAISQETNAAVEELATQSDGMLSFARRNVDLSQLARRKAGTGKAEMSKFSSEMERIAESIEEMGSDAQKLDAIMKEMQAIINIVSGIAEETNLLSLNASIEAARAGEAGRGFSIVAEEVRKLSDETKNSVVEVASLINNTNEQVIQLTTTLEGIRKNVQSSNTSSKETEEYFAEIAETMNDTDNQNGKMAEEIKVFVENIHLLSESVKEVAVSADGLNSLTTHIEQK